MTSRGKLRTEQISALPLSYALSPEFFLYMRQKRCLDDTG